MEVREAGPANKICWLDPAVLCPFQLFDCWNMQWLVSGTSPANKMKSWWECLSPPSGVFLICMHTLPGCSLLCRPVNQTLKDFAVETAPKSSPSHSSSVLLSCCESPRLRLIQSAYSNMHLCKIHLTASQSTSASLLGCLSLPWKITFLPS